MAGDTSSLKNKMLARASPIWEWAPRRKILIQRGCGTGRNDEIVVIIGWSAGAIANIFGARSGGTCWSAGALDKNESERGAEMGVGALER